MPRKASTPSSRSVSRAGKAAEDATPLSMTDHEHYPDAALVKILRSVKTIAMVGASPDWNRPSAFAMKYLQHKGYRVIPVNPKAAGPIINGEICYARPEDIPPTEARKSAV